MLGEFPTKRKLRWKSRAGSGKSLRRYLQKAITALSLRDFQGAITRRCRKEFNGLFSWKPDQQTRPESFKASLEQLEQIGAAGMVAPSRQALGGGRQYLAVALGLVTGGHEAVDRGSVAA